ncbi:MAG TPA: ABC transporter permease [bacterium]|mgnify:CR=1 FL=1|nr:MAG: Inner membrane transport permease YbhS [bacterium ADurb.Bin236]HOY62999.1 ABC transporter permease [bacterium]HPI76811.1 ABC transporter permease [bacterium]HPN94195.1 ABC transporter permease [bacterium]
MNFLTTFSAIVFKEALHLRRDPVTLVVTIAIPIFQLIVFGYAIDMEVKNIPTAVFDADRRAGSRELIAALANTEYFDFKENASSEAELREAIVSGRARVGIHIPPDFTAGALNGSGSSFQALVDGSDSTVAMQAVNVVNSVGLMQSVKQMGRVDIEKLPVDARPRVLFNPDLKSANFFVPGLVGLIMQIVTVFLTAFAVVREKENGTIETLLATPLSRGGLMLGKLVPYAFVGFFEICVVLTLMRFVFGVRVNGDIGLLLLMCFVFLFTALGLGLLISTAAKNQAQAMQMALLVMLPSVLLSGFVFPRESMPAIIYYFSFLIPLTYFIEILRGIILRGADLSSLWSQALALAVYGAAILSLSTLRFSKKLS